MLRFDGLVYRDEEDLAYCPCCHEHAQKQTRLQLDSCESAMGLVNCWRCDVCEVIIRPGTLGKLQNCNYPSCNPTNAIPKEDVAS